MVVDCVNYVNDKEMCAYLSDRCRVVPFKEEYRPDLVRECKARNASIIYAMKNSLESQALNIK